MKSFTGLKRIEFEFGDKKFIKVKELYQEEISKTVLVKEVSTHFTCIIRIIDKTKLSNHERGCLHKEIKIIKKLDHPNIIKIYDYKDTNLCLYLLMEYAPNGNLDQILKKNGKFAEDIAKLIFNEIVSAIQYLHSNGISHRDLKPENILFDYGNIIKIANFGFINSLITKNMNCICDHCHYWAPEILLKQKYDGQKADIYSMGVLLHELVTDDQSESNLSKSCSDLIIQLKSIYPDDRPSLNTVLKNKWFLKSSDENDDATTEEAKSIPQKTIEYAKEKISEKVVLTIYQKFIVFLNACKKGLTFK